MIKFPVPREIGLNPSMALYPVVNVLFILDRLTIEGLFRKKRGTFVIDPDEEEEENKEEEEMFSVLLLPLSSLLCNSSSIDVVVEFEDDNGPFPSIGRPKQSTTRPQNSLPRRFTSTTREALVIVDFNKGEEDKDGLIESNPSIEELLPLSEVVVVVVVES